MGSLIRDEFNTLAIYAFRYALGRKTYAVSEMCDLLATNKDRLSTFARELICKEIQRAIERNDYGMDCDKQEWLRLHDALHG